MILTVGMIELAGAVLLGIHLMQLGARVLLELLIEQGQEGLGSAVGDGLAEAFLFVEGPLFVAGGLLGSRRQPAELHMLHEYLVSQSQYAGGQYVMGILADIGVFPLQLPHLTRQSAVGLGVVPSIFLWSWIIRV